MVNIYELEKYTFYSTKQVRQVRVVGTSSKILAQGQKV
jgi:hypothetical protein